MIRRATAGDIPEMVQLGTEFHAEYLAGPIPYDPHSASAFLREMVHRPEAGIFLIDHNLEVRGMAAAVIAPVFLNFHHKSASEMFWFVRKAHRKTFDSLRLFKALEDWAREQGATTMTMIALATNPGVSAIYERRGYKLQESNYVRSL